MRGREGKTEGEGKRGRDWGTEAGMLGAREREGGGGTEGEERWGRKRGRD